MNDKETTRNIAELPVSGSTLRRIRERCGYTAREFATYLSAMQAPITTARSVYRLQERSIIPPRYVDALRKMVGAGNFERLLRAIVEEDEEHRRRTEEYWRQRKEEEATRARKRRR